MIDAAPTRTPLFIGHTFDVVVAVLLLLLKLCCCRVDSVDMRTSDVWPAMIDSSDALLLEQPFSHVCAHEFAYGNIHTSIHTPK